MPRTVKCPNFCPVISLYLLEIKSPPLDDGLEVLQLIAHDRQQEQHVAEHTDLYIFVFSPETDEHGDGDGEKLQDK